MAFPPSSGRCAGPLLHAVIHDPGNPVAWNEWAVWSIRTGDAASGLAQAERALRLLPGMADALLTRMRALLRLGRMADAENELLSLMLQAPLYPPALLRLAELRLEQGRLQDSFVALAQLLGDLPPAWAAEAQWLLGQALTAAGLTTAAGQALGKAVALDPGRFEAQRWLMALRFETGRFDDGLALYRSLVPIDPDPLCAGSIALYSLNFDPRIDNAGLLRLHREWAAGLPAPTPRPPALPRQDSPRLRVGFMGAKIGRHPVGYFLEPFLANRRASAAILYDGARMADDLGQRLRTMADGWRSTAGLPDSDLADMMNRDGLDILVDLSGHAGGNRLPVLARRVAPVQASWLDYFTTTAVPAMDYAIFDGISVPAGQEAFFTEQVVRLPDSRFCYAPPDYAPAVTPAPAEHGGSITFGCFNKVEKLTPAVTAVWARVLHAVPDARLILKWSSLADLPIQVEMRRRFAAHGIPPSRVILRGQSPHSAMLAEYGEIDIALDPFPYNGGLTSCEALWMGVPVITLAGARPVSRQTLGFLTLLGLSGLAAADEAGYVAAAAALAADRPRLREMRTHLRGRMAASPLCNGARFAVHLERAFTTMMERCRAGLPPQGFAVSPLD